MQKFYFFQNRPGLQVKACGSWPQNDAVQFLGLQIKSVLYIMEGLDLDYRTIQREGIHTVLQL